MSLALNHNPPTIMHVDLNSCFATIEQQANPLLRGKPIVVAAYDSPGGCVVAPSIESKKRVFSIISGKTTMTKLGKCRKFQASNNWSRKGITKIRVKLYAKHENNTKGNHIRPCTS